LKVKIGQIRAKIYHPFVVFLISVSMCMLVLWAERSVGIEWDFHPDANTYITKSNGAENNFMTFYKGNLFYIIVNFFNSNINTVIAFNVFLYALTNVALAQFFIKRSRAKHVLTFILFYLVIFNPYRIHLSVHVLKDTLIIFGLVIFFSFSKRYSWVFLFISFMVSLRVSIYLVSVMNKRNLIIVTVLVVAFILTLPMDFILSVMSTENQVDMTFRTFDNVHNFFELGLLGAIIRALIWPFLYLTGLFFIISPSIMYLPLALGSLFLQIWHIKQFGKLAVYFQIYLSMSILAFMVSGFTSFVRYTLPLLTILPLIVMDNKSVKYEK